MKRTLIVETELGGDSKLSFTKLYTAQVFDPSLFNVLKSSLKTGWRVVLYGAWNEWQGTNSVCRKVHPPPRNTHLLIYLLT
ncbi:hypothetical protein RRG08_065791 [Elysia crispata]|uniref:Uncharacterized protein n=1 Tax=Elysia crispata TaxID=231223 RepID=A0AAE0ZT73_9GAST|nr:hypothetical protein RRG08_065791 [Elysia crispata]